MRDESKKKRDRASFSRHSSFLIPNSSFRPKKNLGQHFLEDESVVERIVQEVGPRRDETIVEIGPGRGILTARLAREAGRLLAIEFDRDLVPALFEKFGALTNFELLEGDALTVDLCAMISPAKKARVVANLPYYISTAILQRLINQRACLEEMVLMLQREVVDRIIAAPSSSDRGFLSVLVEAYCETDKLFDVPPTAFRPVPKVWSTVVRLTVRPQIAIDVEDETLLWRVVSAGFAQRRKTIFNNLRSTTPDLRSQIESVGGAREVLGLSQIEPRRRAETLSLEEWARLTQAIADSGLPIAD